jgi:hypothetical protein
LRRERIANSKRTYNVAAPIRYSQFAIRSLKGGAGRSGSRPVACDLDRVGRKERPARSSPTAASRLDRPFHRLQAGSRRLDLAASQAPGRRLGGLPTNRPTRWTAAPRLPIEARCRPPPSSSPRRGAGKHIAGRMSLSVYVNNQYGLTISLYPIVCARTVAMPRAAKLSRVALTEPPTSMPRQASSITATSKPWRLASSAE